jgi:hypothetical protein
MRRLRSFRVLGIALACIALVAAGNASRARSSHAASPGLIVFASDRDKANPARSTRSRSGADLATSRAAWRRITGWPSPRSGI